MLGHGLLLLHQRHPLQQAHHPLPQARRHRRATQLHRRCRQAVKGCLGALDTATPSTSSGGKKRAPAQLRVYHLSNTTTKMVEILENLPGKKAKKKMVTLPQNGACPTLTPM
ncbi:hypothetical protein Cni_G25582 [Canna indica]|uniref:Uncharacterized protein n=1 Tax=Canna indica TaxID=4628 RepID=A0AAQ3KXZ2_9LILI|nr:hypothetical protein Cni_G25582 [Canna indica]